MTPFGKPCLLPVDTEVGAPWAHVGGPVSSGDLAKVRYHIRRGGFRRPLSDRGQWLNLRGADLLAVQSGVLKYLSKFPVEQRRYSAVTVGSLESKMTCPGYALALIRIIH